MHTLSQWLNASPLPKNEARLLLQHVMGYTHAQLITRNQEILSSKQCQTLNNLARRRQKGEPIAYLLGTREFYGRGFTVSPDTLIPRHETEHLLEYALVHLPKYGILWDMGTGSGIIAITTKLERPDSQVYASDISENALNIARHNAQQLGAQVCFAQGSWFEANAHFSLAPHSVQIIVSNPPYIQQNDNHLQQGDLRFEPLHALTDFADGLSHIRHIVQHAPAYLAPQGYLLLEHGYNQGQVVRDILCQYGFDKVQTLPDLAGLDRVSLGRL